MVRHLVSDAGHCRILAARLNDRDGGVVVLHTSSLGRTQQNTFSPCFSCSSKFLGRRITQTCVQRHESPSWSSTFALKRCAHELLFGRVVLRSTFGQAKDTPGSTDRDSCIQPSGTEHTARLMITSRGYLFEAGLQLRITFNDIGLQLIPHPTLESYPTLILQLIRKHHQRPICVCWSWVMELLLLVLAF